MGDVRVVFHAADGGAAAMEAYDLPEQGRPSLRLPYSTLDLQRATEPAANGAEHLLLHPAATWPVADRVVDDANQTRYLYMYRPREREAMLAFERRIQPRYNDYYIEHGMRYAGLYDVDGLEGSFVAELVAFDMPVERAKAFVAEHKPAADIAAIEDECRTLQDREGPRYLIWIRGLLAAR